MATAVWERPRTSRASRKAPLRGGAVAPLLDNGYHLAQGEFHRRYGLMPEVKKAELIEGVGVFVRSLDAP